MMKPATIPLAVILLITATLLIGGSLGAKKETEETTLVNNYCKASLKEDKAMTLPQPDTRQYTAPTLVKSENKRLLLIE